MTNLPRVMVSMPPDIEKAVEDMRKEPGNERVPKSKLLCRLVRKGMEREEDAKTPPDGGAWQEDSNEKSEFHESRA